MEVSHCESDFDSKIQLFFSFFLYRVVNIHLLGLVPVLPVPRATLAATQVQLALLARRIRIVQLVISTARPALVVAPAPLLLPAAPVVQLTQNLLPSWRQARNRALGSLKMTGWAWRTTQL